MKYLSFLLCASVLVSACSTTPKNETASSESLTNAPTLPQLTEEQKAEGWRLLFDGQSTNGWKIFKDRKNNSWEVADGVLHCKAPSEAAGVENERSDIMTTDQI